MPRGLWDDIMLGAGRIPTLPLLRQTVPRQDASNTARPGAAGGAGQDQFRWLQRNGLLAAVRKRTGDLEREARAYLQAARLRPIRETAVARAHVEGCRGIGEHALRLGELLRGQGCWRPVIGNVKRLKAKTKPMPSRGSGMILVRRKFSCSTHGV